MPTVTKYNVNAMAYAALIIALHEGGGTVSDLAEESGLSPMTVAKLIHALRKRKAIHVVSWERDALGRLTVRSYALGPGKDAPRPPRKTDSEKCRVYYTKQQQVAAATGCRVKDARLAGMKRNVFGVLEAA